MFNCNTDNYASDYYVMFKPIKIKLFENNHSG